MLRYTKSKLADSLVDSDGLLDSDGFSHSVGWSGSDGLLESVVLLDSVDFPCVTTDAVNPALTETAGHADFVTTGGRWTDSGGTSSGSFTNTLGGSGGVVAWSIAGAGLTNNSGQAFFTGSTVDLGTFLPADYVTQLRNAFAAWGEAANIEFIQVADGGGNIGVGTSPTIRIVGGNIDGTGNINGRAFFPSDNSGFPAAGDVVFDSTDGATFALTNGFYLIALHEIGHALGLDHEPSSPTGDLAIMNAFLNFNAYGTGPLGDYLQQDDIDGIRAVYGAQDFGANNYFLPTGTLNLTLIDEAPLLTIVGNASDNGIAGNGVGNTIYGLGGADVISGLEGDDYMRGDAGGDSLYGGGGNDQVFGGTENDALFGDYSAVSGTGNDTLYGEGGDDTIVAGEGNDFADGGIGNDSIYGNNGADILAGYDGNDYINGGFGTDQIYGNEGNDSLDGGDADDLMFGGNGNDSLQGGSGNDQMLGEGNDDVLQGQGGNDYLQGGAGNDSMFGGTGNDTFDGGAGNDFLVAGDTVGGADGSSDAFYFRGTWGVDTVSGFGDSGGDQDILYFQQSVVGSIQAVFNSMSQQGANVLIALDANHGVWVTSTTVAALTDDIALFI